MSVFVLIEGFLGKNEYAAKAERMFITKLSKLQTDKEIKVVLDEGKVNFSSAGSTYSLQPGQKFIFDKITGEAKVANLNRSTDESKWRENYIRLNDTPLFETLNLLDRQFDVRFKVTDAKASYYSFTLTTNDKPLDFILDELEKIAPIKFTQENDTVFVKVDS